MRPAPYSSSVATIDYSFKLTFACPIRSGYSAVFFELYPVPDSALRQDLCRPMAVSALADVIYHSQWFAHRAPPVTGVL